LGQSLECHLGFQLPYHLIQKFKGVEHFQNTRKVILQIIEKFQPLVKKWNTTYRCAIPIGIACLEFSCKANYLQYSKLFMIRKSFVNMLLMLCLGTKFNGHKVKICQGWWWASMFGVPPLLFMVQSIAHRFTFKNLKELCYIFLFI
jgi:hypothetical protein